MTGVSIRMLLLVLIVAKHLFPVGIDWPQTAYHSNDSPAWRLIDDSVFNLLCFDIDLEKEHTSPEQVRCRYYRNYFHLFFLLIGQFAVLLVHIV